MFLDRVKIIAQAGLGGNGCLSFRREKYVPFGGPDGGNGGPGGSIYLAAKSGRMNLSDFYRKVKFSASAGMHGKGKNMYGKAGSDWTIDVPVGTVVYSLENGEKIFLKDLSVPGETLLVAKGGRGGRGNASFKTRFNTAPKIADRGEAGEVKELILELKIVADCGIIGLPNAGKSSLLDRISAAHPEIADYPFTTKSPNLGIVSLGFASYTFVDIPGLIEGAAGGKGMGVDFLRHIERTKLLAHVIDVTGYFNSDPVENYSTIRRELELYSPLLMKKREIIILNKTDLVSSADIKKVKAALTKKTGIKEIFPLSLATGKGLDVFIEHLRKNLDKYISEYDLQARGQSVDGAARHRDYSFTPDFTVEKKENIFIISGKAVERLVSVTYLEKKETLERFQKFINRMKIEERLREMGAKDGDTVRIAKTEFIFRDETGCN